MYRHFPQVDASDFAWAGSGRSTDQRNKYRVNYDECRVNGLSIHTGDFVLLGTWEWAGIEGCTLYMYDRILFTYSRVSLTISCRFRLAESDGDDCVCQVTEMFDPGFESDDKSPSGIVQWYWRLDEFRKERRLWRKMDSMELKPHPSEGTHMLLMLRLPYELVQQNICLSG